MHREDILREIEDGLKQMNAQQLEEFTRFLVLLKTDPEAARQEIERITG